MSQRIHLLMHACVICVFVRPPAPERAGGSVKAALWGWCVTFRAQGGRALLCPVTWWDHLLYHWLYKCHQLSSRLLKHDTNHTLLSVKCSGVFIIAAFSPHCDLNPLMMNLVFLCVWGIYGTWCAVCSPGNGAWCRAMVTGLSDDKVAVNFVDYGYSLTVEKGHLRSITAQLLTLPFQAVRCWLTGSWRDCIIALELCESQMEVCSRLN